MFTISACFIPLQQIAIQQIRNRNINEGKERQVPLFSVFAPTINWVMVHVASSLSRRQRGGSDRPDGPAITGSPETELNLLPTLNISICIHIQP